ncbi:hypothetical protein B0T25DRAFT_610595 [Lasiosphaeria hispida]|uniref:Heterokaryon incompatibility domain-containing protein n=1 Tax=Lasiosphaeria hispida TaxID=260671 RepID=A0AAJ0HF38_9PEZI|nr:hypothetical protein B0T25DRAFT_610595 [Lasiosphaeria hispida]
MQEDIGKLSSFMDERLGPPEIPDPVRVETTRGSANSAAASTEASTEAAGSKFAAESLKTKSGQTKQSETNTHNGTAPRMTPKPETPDPVRGETARKSANSAAASIEAAVSKFAAESLKTKSGQTKQSETNTYNGTVLGTTSKPDKPQNAAGDAHLALQARWKGLPPRVKKMGRSTPKRRAHGLISSSMVKPPTPDADWEEDLFHAELYTSSLRSRASHKPYTAEDESVSTFTVRDKSGRLGTFLERLGCLQGRVLASVPTFHVQVVAPDGPVSGTFRLAPALVKKAEKLTVHDNSAHNPTDIFILAFVFDLGASPIIALYVDPWQSYLDGTLSLEPYNEYTGYFKQGPIIQLSYGEDAASHGGHEVFKHEALRRGEIRLIQLSPGRDDDPLRGTSSTRRSRTWARSGPSLTSGASRPAAASEQAYLEADAICINQHDSREKVLQIRLMGDIFRRAERVVAWLGCEYQGSGEAMDALARAGADHRAPDLKDCVWDCISRLLKRARIVQEVVLPPRVTLMCDDREQQLFALLGLAHDSDNERFNPDCDSPLPEIVRRYAEGFVLRGQAMDLLYRAGVSRSYPFCSWIPRWMAPDLEFPRSISTWDAAERFASGGPPQPCFTTARQLVVKGYLFDVAASDFCELVEYASRYTNEEKNNILVTLPIGDARRPHLESWWNRLRADLDLPAAEPDGWPPNLGQLVLSDGPDQSPAACHDEETLSRYWKTAMAFSHRLYNADFCFTKSGHVGLVPGAAITGDQISLVHGGGVPFLLRRDGQSYRLIGECYVHGIMHGEALRSGLEETTVAVPGLVVATTAMASMNMPWKKAPTVNMLRRPSTWRISTMPRPTPMKPMPVFMMEYLKASSTLTPDTIMNAETICEYNESLAEPVPFQADPDVAGIGVIASFLVSAWLTFAVALYTYCSIRDAIEDDSPYATRLDYLIFDYIDAIRNRVLNKALKLCTFITLRPVARNVSLPTTQPYDSIFVRLDTLKGKFPWGERTLVTKQQMETVCLMFADQQLVTGASILIVGYVRHYEITQYHFYIVSILGLISFTTFQSVVLIIRGRIKQKLRRGWRCAWVTALFACALVTNFIIYNDNFLGDLHRGLSMHCVWMKLPEHFRLDQIPYVVFGTLVDVWSYLNILSYLYPETNDV